MNEWISKAANVFKRDVPDTPQSFEVYCECGQNHAGIRRAAHQHLICKACGASLFVLPQDVYPPPHIPNPVAKKRKKKRPKVGTTAPEIDFSPEFGQASGRGQLSENESLSKPRKRGKHPEVDEHHQSATDLVPQPGLLSRTSGKLTGTIQYLRSAWREFWTPYRQLALLILGVLALTGYYAIRQSRLRDAVMVAKVELDLGSQAVAERDWVQARQHFERATAAVDLLGRGDLEANAIRQYLRETTALTRLTSTPLFELMDLAEEHYVQHGAEHWQEEFERKFQGGWYVIEGDVRSVNDPAVMEDGFQFELVYPVTVGSRQRPVNVQVDFRLANHLPAVNMSQTEEVSEGILTVFAAQLSECFIGQDGEWVVRFNPQTSFFWVNRPTYIATHLDVGSIQSPAELQQMFELQAKWMGVRQ